jgi:hypothetical protein
MIVCDKIIIIIIIMLLKYSTIQHCCADKTTYYLQQEAIGRLLVLNKWRTSQKNVYEGRERRKRTCHKTKNLKVEMR